MVTPESFSHVGIRSEAVADTVTFLETHLDATVRGRSEIVRGEWEETVSAVNLELADKTAYVVNPTPYEAAGLVEAVPPGIAHYGITVADVESALDIWTNDGGSILMDAFDLDGTKYAFCRGPDGIRIELVEE